MDANNENMLRELASEGIAVNLELSRDGWLLKLDGKRGVDPQTNIDVAVSQGIAGIAKEHLKLAAVKRKADAEAKEAERKRLKELEKEDN